MVKAFPERRRQPSLRCRSGHGRTIAGRGMGALGKLSPLTNLAPAIVFGADRRVIASAPYREDWQTLRRTFARPGRREELAASFEAWIAALRAHLDVAFVWIGGSFVTDKPEPNDIDAVVFFRYRTDFATGAERAAFLRSLAPLLDHATVEQDYRIDSAFAPLDVDVGQLLHIAAYWAMVFSNDETGGRRAFFTVDGQSILQGS